MKFALPAAEVPGVLLQLQQAIEQHELWHANLNRTLICSLEPADDDLAIDAHRRCRFGRWYCDDSTTRLRAHPAFAGIGATHEAMHEQARQLLQAKVEAHSIPAQAYDRFGDAVRSLRLEVSALRKELEDSYYNTDPLTGAITRASLLTRLREQQALAQREAEWCCLAMMDLDRFKVVNDTYGHLAGDRVLVAAAACAIDNVRPYDTVYRYGGEEFLILLRHARQAEALQIVDRVRQQLADLQIDIGATRIGITASFGVVELDADAPVETSISRADQAMYAAKQAGRNRVVAWDPAAVAG